MILVHDNNLSYFHQFSFNLNHVILLNICTYSAFILKMENTSTVLLIGFFFTFFFMRNAHNYFSKEAHKENTFYLFKVITL